jgi:hypothetical protein
MKHDDGYDAAADMAASILECYREIRERMARGGSGFDPERKPPELKQRGERAA